VIVERGLRVNQVTAGGPSDTAGVRIGDVIREIDGRLTPTRADVWAVLDAKKPGDHVTLLVVRDGTERPIAITIGARP
jgi:S1-C subfamily serine protease